MSWYKRWLRGRALAPFFKRFLGSDPSACRVPSKKRRQALCFEELEGRVVLSVAAPIVTTNTNWSGYAAQTNLNTPQNGAVTAVGGSWVVPTITGTARAFSATWIGIDGYSSSTVEQIGTEQDASSNGKGNYYAWYEMYPDDSVTIPNFTVAPGDFITAEVSYASGVFTLKLTDAPQSGGTVESYSTTATIAGAEESSADWIMEAPSGRNVLPLASFGTMTFSDAWATISGTTGPIDDPAWQAAQMNMVSYSGFHEQTVTTVASASSLTDSPPSVTGALAPPAGTTAVSNFTMTYGPAPSSPTSTASVPVASGPSGTIASDQPAFSWSAATGAASYEIWLTDQSTGATTTVPNVSGTTWTPAQPLNLGDNYIWWVGAAQGNTIAWDNGLTFTILPSANGPSGAIASDQPAFSWSALTGVTSYEVWLTDQTTGTTVIAPNLTGKTWTPAQPLNLGDNYIWWVGALQGKTTIWDNALTFTILPAASGPSGTISTDLPAFSWTPLTGVASYEIWLTDQTTGATVTAPNLTGTTWTPAQPLNLGDNYIWWLGAVQGTTAVWDKALTFTIQPTATGPSGTIATNLPTFSWNAVTGAVSYEVWLTDQTTGTTVTAPYLTGTTWTPNQPLNLGDNYIWWVGAVQGKTTVWNKALTFTIQPTAAAPSGAVSTATPAFSWNTVTGAASYEIWLTDQTAGTTVTYVGLTSTAWTPAQPLNVGDSYIWWVGAVQGQIIAWDSALSFTVSA